MASWSIIFYTAAAILVAEFVLYSLLASGEEQDWNRMYADGAAKQPKKRGGGGVHSSPEDGEPEPLETKRASYD